MSSPNADGLTEQQTKLRVIGAVCMVIPTIAVGLRFWSRQLCRGKVWWDDFCIVVALLVDYGMCICLLLSITSLRPFIHRHKAHHGQTNSVGVNHGLGRHFNELALPDIMKVFHIFLPLQILFVVNFTFTYVAIALLYIRLFPETKLRKAAIVMGIIGLLDGIADVGTLIWQCTPVAFFWDKSIPGGHCINQTLSYKVASAIIVVLISTLFFLPIPTIYSLHMSSAKKLGLAVTLSMGFFVCITSIFRIIYLGQVDERDISWTAVNVQIWGCLEAAFGIVAACFPSLRPLVRILVNKMSGTAKSTNGPYSDNSISKPRASKFNRMVDRSDPTATFSENIDLNTRSHLTQDDHDDRARLVQENPKEGGIVVTNDVTQVNERAHDKDLEKQQQAGISPTAWHAPSAQSSNS